MEIDKESLKNLIEISLKEDVGEGDHTTLSIIPENLTGKAQLIIKQNGVIAGIKVAEYIFNYVDPAINFTAILNDGVSVKAGEIAFKVEGRIHTILKLERLVLNIMQRMSGIATQTKQYADCLKGLKTRVLDTRKTTPGMRSLDKYSVKAGGGENHRFGLYDMILIKDNHIDYAGGIKNAIEKATDYLKKTNKNLKIEVEARSINDIKTILQTGSVDRILLDNFSVELTREAVALIAGAVETESSGNITLQNIRDYAECGVDYISVGALTHQIKSLDLSLKAFF